MDKEKLAANLVVTTVALGISLLSLKVASKAFVDAANILIESTKNN